MTNTMTYNGYAARIEYDEDEIFMGRIAGIRDGVGCFGVSPDRVGRSWALVLWSLRRVRNAV